MFVQLTLFAGVLLCYGGSYATSRRPTSTREIGKCGEKQNFTACSNDISLFLSRPLFSYNPASDKCEFVFKQCSRTRANKFKTKAKCKRYCKGRKKGCFRKRKWYDHGEQMDSIGCCQCWDGFMACAASCLAYEDFNGPPSQQEISMCSTTCESGHNHDCTFDCQRECTSCFSGDSDCPDECDCTEELFNLAEQIIY